MTYQASKQASKTDFTVDLIWWGSPQLNCSIYKLEEKEKEREHKELYSYYVLGVEYGG